MEIREATESDKSVWNNFVNEHDGIYHQYFDWKYVYQTDGQDLSLLMIEKAPSVLVGIFSLIKEKHTLYSKLNSSGLKGILFKKGMSPDETNIITRDVIKYIDQKYSSRCSTIFIREQLPLGAKDEQNQALVDSGFHIRYRNSAGLPCSYILPLEVPFNENTWNLCSRSVRKSVNRVEKSGVIVIQDRELQYLEEFLKMVTANYQRHRNQPPSRDYMLAVFKYFKNSTKLFVAMDHGLPVAALACFYTASTCFLWEMGTFHKEADEINKYCYKVAMEDACNEGYKYADMSACYTTGLAVMKERFGAQRTPLMIYEKRYSLPRVLLQHVPVLLRLVVFNPKYFWDNRSAFLNSIRRW